ncbi:contractile injection system protein, VgrG/Pvc8 family [Lysinibacillus sphaericus]|uniref:contractile injection system protein, VgrG/Pvc8 family n=2 Tax=Lysinibacillus sphaericus TaxID=1421 RepID=UPI001CBF04EF|nr:contractile injection system protein, VgrG/Pvc8 family [Lysinibacillus sphaericus]
MNTYEEVIGYGELELVSPYEVQTLHDLSLTQTVNDHARLSITGFIPEEKKDRCMQLASSSDRIELYQKRNGQRVRPLFKGQVSEMAVRMVRGIYQIEIEAVSSTFALDCKRNARSFQHNKMTYNDMLKQVLANFPGADVIDTASKATALKQFILQYKETDWQFLKRMASHFRTVLVPAVDADKPKLWFGLPEGRLEQLSTANYTISKDRSKYLHTLFNDNERPMEERDTISYVIESKKTLALGDRVQLQNKELVVAKSIARMQQGVLTYEYHLLSEAGIRQGRLNIPSLSGTAIEGKVLEVKKDRVRLHLSIDEAQKKEEATWFPLATPYTAEGHSGFYSPPEEGDSVHLAFPTHREEAAIVRHSVRKGGDSNQKTADPKTSYWGTPKGKDIKLDPQSVTFTAKEGAVFLKLHQESGIEVHSKHPITLKANDNITFVGKSISMSAKESMHLTCGSSSIVLDGNTDMQGQIVTMEGSNKAPVSVSNTSGDGADLESALDVMGSIPVGGGGA